MVDQHAADTLQPFLDQLHEALTAVANGDPEPMKALCSHTDAISQCWFWGGVEHGWRKSVSAGTLGGGAVRARYGRGHERHRLPDGYWRHGLRGLHRAL